MSVEQPEPIPESSSRTFSVLAVCTGNICRSPAVERLLAAALGLADGDPRTAGVQVTSAGVRAVVGAPMPAPMATMVDAVGASSEGFAARQLTAQMLRDADLVLALTRGHRSKIVTLHPGAVRRTFTLRELARLVEGVDPAALPTGTLAERLAALLPLAVGQRGLRPTAPDLDDVVDPYGGDDALYRRAFAELRPAVEEIARVARG